MAGTVTITYQIHTTIKMIQWAWTSDASGNANGTSTVAISGTALRWVTNPDNTDAPTLNYDITVDDPDGADIAGGALANRHNSNTEQAFEDPPKAFSSTLELKVSSAGNAKKGVVKLYYR